MIMAFKMRLFKRLAWLCNKSPIEFGAIARPPLSQIDRALGFAAVGAAGASGDLRFALVADFRLPDVAALAVTPDWLASRRWA